MMKNCFLQALGREILAGHPGRGAVRLVSMSSDSAEGTA